MLSYQLLQPPLTNLSNTPTATTTSSFWNRVVEALVIPLILILIGSIAKKLTRGRGWERQDFYFGIELSLSAISGALTLLFDSSAASSKGLWIGLFLAIAFVAFLFILACHQDNQHTTPQREILWLVVISNIIGVTLMFGFVFVIKN